MSSATSIGIAGTIFIVFTFLAVLLPFIYADLDTSAASFNSEGVVSDIADESVGASDVALSFFQVFFWSFGTFPFWLDMFFTIFRVMFAVAVFNIIVHGS